MQLFQINQSEESSKITKNAHTVTSAVHYKCTLYCVFITVAISKLRNSKLVVPLQCCCCCCTSCIVVAGVSGGPLCPVHYLNVWPRETACNLHLRDTTHSSSPLTRSSADPTHSHNITQNSGE